VKIRKICSTQHSCSQELSFQWAIFEMVRYVHLRCQLPAEITLTQKSYDFLVNETGCAKPKADTLSCLRSLRYATLKAAVDKGPLFTDYQVRQEYLSMDELTIICLSVIKSCLDTTHRWYISQKRPSKTCGAWFGCQGALCGRCVPVL